MKKILTYSLLILSLLFASDALAEKAKKKKGKKAKVEEVEEELLSDEDVEPAAIPAENAKPKDTSQFIVRTQKEYIPFDGIDMTTLKTKLPSMVFKPGNAERFYTQLASYKQSGGVLPNSLEIFQEVEQPQQIISGQPDISALKVQEEKLSSPSIFLSSILYESKENWTIWIHGKKVRFGEKAAIPDFEIIDVKADRATLRWKPKGLGRLSPNYTSDLIAITPNSKNENKDNYEWNLKSSKQSILVDGIREVVQFTIKPNQTFVGYYMKIVEGFVEDIPLQQNLEAGRPVEEFGGNKRLKQQIQSISPEANLEGLDL